PARSAVLPPSPGKGARHVVVSRASPAATANVNTSNSHGEMTPLIVRIASAVAAATIQYSVIRISFRRSTISPRAPAGSANRKNGNDEAGWGSATSAGLAPSGTISHAAPTPCINRARADRRSATKRFLKSGFRSGVQSDGDLGGVAFIVPGSQCIEQRQEFERDDW